MLLSNVISGSAYAAPPTLEAISTNIIRKYLGAMFEPSDTTCFTDSAGSTPTAKDGVVGCIKCSAGSNLIATQATAGSKPILRKGAKNRLLNTDWALGTVAGSPGTAPTSWGVSAAPTGVTRTIGVGTDAHGRYLEVRYAGTNTSGSTAYLAVQSANTLASVPGLTWTQQCKVALMAGAWPTSARVQIDEQNSSGSFLTSGPYIIKTVVTSSTPVLVSNTRTCANASCARVSSHAASFTINNNETVDFTFRIYDPMLEIGSTASPYVATTTAPASNGIGTWWLDFDGVDDRLVLSAVPFQMSDDHFVVAGAHALSASNLTIFEVGSGGTARIASKRFNANVPNTLWNDGTTTASVFQSAEKRFTPVVHSSRQAGSARTVRVNGDRGAGSVTTVLQSFAGASAMIGARTSSNEFWLGPIYGIYIGKGTITDSELRVVETQAGRKAGVII